MAERHQFWVIGRVQLREEQVVRYRCLAGVHNQWSIGRQPVQALYNFITLCGNSHNKRLIQTEIHSTQSFYDPDSTASPTFPHIPCPFLTHVLIQCCGVGKDSVPLSARMSSFDMANDNGITVIDISDLCNIRYCIVYKGWLERYQECHPKEHEYRKKTYTYRLSAADYVSIYYTLPDDAALDAEAMIEVFRCIEALREYSLIGWTAISQAWPDDGYPEETTSSLPVLKTAKFPPLSSLCLRMVLPVILKEDRLEQLPTSVVNLNEQASQIVRDAIRQNAVLGVNRATLLEWLVTSESDSGSLDLSGLNLTLRDIELIAKLVPTVKCLDLSGSSRAWRKTDLEQISLLLPNLECLCLLNCPKTKTVDVRKFCASRHSTYAILHTGHLRAWIDKKQYLLNRLVSPSQDPSFRFTIVLQERDFHLLAYSYVLPYFNLSTVIQIFYDVLASTAHQSHVSWNTELLMIRLVATMSRGEKDNWSERPITAPAICLRGVEGFENPLQLFNGWTLMLKVWPKRLGYGFARFKVGTPGNLHDLDSFVAQNTGRGDACVWLNQVKALLSAENCPSSSAPKESDRCVELMSKKELKELTECIPLTCFYPW